MVMFPVTGGSEVLISPIGVAQITSIAFYLLSHLVLQAPLRLEKTRQNTHFNYGST